MDRAYESHAVAQAPAVPEAMSKGYPTGGNPMTGQRATRPGPWWYHMITEELMGVLAAANITPDHRDTDQLLEAILLVARVEAVKQELAKKANIAGARFTGDVGVPLLQIIGGAEGEQALKIQLLRAGGRHPWTIGLDSNDDLVFWSYVEGAYRARVALSREGFVDAAGLSVNQRPVWHAGNFDPSLLAAPPGSLLFVPFASTVPGYLKINGATLSRATYAALLTALGPLAGPGDGVTTFTLPDWRAEFPRFWDDGRGIDAGRVLGSFQADEFKAHSHDLWGNASSADNNSGSAMINFDLNYPQKTKVAGGKETRPRNVAIQPLIKY